MYCLNQSEIIDETINLYYLLLPNVCIFRTMVKHIKTEYITMARIEYFLHVALFKGDVDTHFHCQYDIRSLLDFLFFTGNYYHIILF